MEEIYKVFDSYTKKFVFQLTKPDHDNWVSWWVNEEYKSLQEIFLVSSIFITTVGNGCHNFTKVDVTFVKTIADAEYLVEQLDNTLSNPANLGNHLLSIFDEAGEKELGTISFYEFLPEDWTKITYCDSIIEEFIIRE